MPNTRTFLAVFTMPGPIERFRDSDTIDTYFSGPSVMCLDILKGYRDRGVRRYHLWRYPGWPKHARMSRDPETRRSGRIFTPGL